MNNLKTVEAAGGLTLDANERVLFIFKDGRWDLPKGLVDRTLSAAETAVKEVSEETGLSKSKLGVVTELIPTIHVSKFSKTRSLKHTRWFLLRYAGTTEKFSPQKAEGIEHCAWIPLWDLDRAIANCPARISYLINFWQKVRRDISL